MISNECTNCSDFVSEYTNSPICGGCFGSLENQIEKLIKENNEQKRMILLLQDKLSAKHP